jgi:ubiquinone biosynthesis protein COQ4
MERVIPAAAADDLPMVDPARPPLRWQPRKAWRHFRILVKDKERTEEVFRIFEALPWTGIYAAAEKFLTSTEGKRIRAAEPYLPELLDNHQALRRTPKGSLGHAYCDFMEGEGLSAQGLVEEYAKFAAGRPAFRDQVAWYFHRLRDTHDLQHVLTGFGRDALGEQCVLAFTYGQQPALAHLFLGYAGGLEIKKRVKSRAPVLRAIREGQKIGRACPRLVEMPVMELMALPVGEVRRRLNIAEPVAYREVHRQWRAMGIDPDGLLTKAV